MVSQLKKIVGTLPFLIAIATVSLVIFCSWYLYRIPSDGMDWSPVDGLVKAVHTPGPAAGRIEPGDFILTIDDTQSSIVGTTLI